METMRAVQISRFGGPETLEMKTVPKPKPGPGELLVRVDATAVNPIDWKLREGYFKDLPLPFIPGGDFCGSIEEAGPGVTSLQKGDTVYGVAKGSMGADAEYVTVPASNVSLKPVTLGPVEAASVPLVAMTAWQGLFTHGGLKSQQTVLILGASGGVGSIAVQLARLAGATVLGTGSAENLARLQELGCAQAIDYKKERFEDLAKDVDLCLDLVGGEFQKRAYAVVKRGGRLISTVQPPDEKAAARRGIVARFFRMQPDAGQLREIAAKFDAGELVTQVAKILPLEKAAEAEELNRQQKLDGKIVLQVFHA